MRYAPFVRIIIRYVVGLIVGADAADTLAGDPDIVTVCALALGGLVEIVYTFAKRKGWST